MPPAVSRPARDRKCAEIDRSCAHFRGRVLPDIGFARGRRPAAWHLRRLEPDAAALRIACLWSCRPDAEPLRAYPPRRREASGTSGGFAVRAGDRGGAQSRSRGGLRVAGLSQPHPSATYGLLPESPPFLLAFLRSSSSSMPTTGTCATNMLDAGASRRRCALGGSRTPAPPACPARARRRPCTARMRSLSDPPARAGDDGRGARTRPRRSTGRSGLPLPAARRPGTGQRGRGCVRATWDGQAAEA